MYKPDSIDRRIVELLGKDARQTSEVIASTLNLSAATVRRRIRGLIDNKLLEIIGVVNPDDFGLPLVAMLALNVRLDKIESTIKILDEYPEIRFSATTSGRFDIITIARFSSMAELSDFILGKLSQIDGMRDSEAFICLDVKKWRYIPL